MKIKLSFFKLLHVTAFILLFSYGASSQGYTRALGIRGGLSSGFEYRVYNDDLISYKILLSTRYHGFQITGLKEFHQYELFEFTDQLIFVYGFGLHAGYERWTDYYYHNYMRWPETRSSLLAGLDGLAGLEYIFYEFPLSVGIEVKPFFDVMGRKNFHLQLFDFAFTIKYLF